MKTAIDYHQTNAIDLDMNFELSHSHMITSYFMIFKEHY
jgi:hypothetical protein